MANDNLKAILQKLYANGLPILQYEIDEIKAAIKKDEGEKKTAPEDEMHQTPQLGIVLSILAIKKQRKPISQEYKIKFANCLDWLIKNEKDNHTLSWCYNLRGEIHAGHHPEICETE